MSKAQGPDRRSEPVTHRTYALPRRELLACTDAAFAVTRHAKDLRNCVVYAIRQVLSAYDNGALRPELHPDQRAVLDLANRCVAEINAQREEKAPAKGKEPKLLPAFGSTANPFTILDNTLLDNVVRALPDVHGTNAYRCLPATAAQQLVRDVIGDFRTWFKALSAYSKAPEAFTGRPGMPDYLDKNGRTVVSFPWSSLSSGHFVPVEGKPLALDYARTQGLPADAALAFGEFDLAGAVARLTEKHHLTGARPVEVRLVPQPARATKVEVVFEVPCAPLRGLAHRVTAALGSEITGVAREKALKAQLATTPVELLKHLAGCDFGLNNLATVAFAGGQRGLVVGGRRIEARIAHLDKRLDEALAAAAPAELKALQTRKDKGEELKQAEMVHLRQLQKAVHQDPAVLKLRASKKNFTRDAAHRVTQGLVQRLVDAGVHVLIVGQNRGWKNGALTEDKGARFNRRNLNIPHALLLEQLRYKAEALGILVVTTEESYTSKTAFALNEPLRVKERRPTTRISLTPHPSSTPALAAAPAPENSETRTDAPGSAADVEHLNPFLGPRPGRRKAHWFTVADGTSPRPPSGWARVHADINGAFNIIRKVCLKFQWREHLTPSFELLWLSPRLGLSAMKL